ncbi:hypothetical protein SAMN05428942_2176 [Streptomyces sp. 2112.2]|uniref:hypothetical protein n=1 Tax=Streptomyces sp. 2112.2 TaxID=1881024 RepID=UPI00089423C5|nr:hypothetical protein [Streptomyces sp. 2112.2]SED64012.1 hypothetical protein SAMN05428942_2176 [Streptomyces sp. 2112.2]
MSSHHRYPGIAQFPRPVPVDVEVLGLALDVTIGRHQVTVTLPVLEGEAQFTPPPDRLGRLDRLIAPPDVTGEALPKALLRTCTDVWGYRSTQRICYVEAVAISPILDPEEDVLDEPVRDLGNKFFSWFRIFQEWACAWSGEPMQDFDPYLPSVVHVVDDQGAVISNGPRERGVYVWPRPLNRDQVAGAMRRASAGELLPPEHRTLLEAVEAKVGAMPRKAVVDAATAVEVAMGGYITRELTSRGVGASFIDEVIKGVNGLMSLHSLCTELGADPGVSKNKLGAQLANIRNRAAHAGVRPTWAEVVAACDHAATIVHAITPLPEA